MAEVENNIENNEINQQEEAVDSTLYPVAMEEPEQDEEVYIPFGNLAVELIENAMTGEASENTQHSENALAEDSIVLVREEEEDYSKTDEGLTQKYIEDFIYSNASENAAGSPSSDVEGRQLSKFPKIAKAVEGGNAEVIAALYHLIFLRNAWDTQEILIQRILNFTGFNCEENSDDHFTREMIIHSFSDELLLSIAAMLGIEHIRVKPIYFEKEKARLISLIMKFLNKPQPKRRQSRGPRQPNATALNKKSDETKAPVRRRGKKKKVLSPAKTVSQILFSQLTTQNDKTLKNQISTNLGLLPEPIVIVKDEINKDKLGEKDGKNAVQDKKADGNKDASVSKRKKLRDFPTVTKCVRRTPEELLMDIHVLLFSEAGENHRLKRNILDFEGFNFESDSEEYDERRDFLDRMSDKTVDDVAKTFSLEAKSTKDETISHVLSFLKKPDESLIKVPEKKEGDESSGLSDIDELDIAEMFESDDSVTCEVVPKRVECIDLISSGDESDKERKRAARQQALGAKTVTKAAVPTTTFSSAASFAVASFSSTEEPPPSGGRRTLSNFETICKIVNTHPDEYLVDIYDLLYLKQHEPRTLRKEILEFPGFDFMKGSPEYVKRKLLLDRMLYNSVRRIYNTLIHTSTEVKMFSKPAMITEIFEFLLKLPDKDTSIINMQQRNSKPVTTLPINRVTPLIGTQKPGIVIPPVSAPSQPGKLSDLKRVFQRVACFPCEYLIDVHKLLFMTDCDTKVIRQNIFGFKGFNFGVDSNEFQQRKMYLEYLTFHSLRKISSVLTTKTVDLRNSTKHELASHLTDVLAEYTNTYFDGTGTTALQNNVPQIVVTTSQQAVTTTQQVTANAQLNIPMSTDSGIEQIVVTPIIEPIISSPTTSPEPPTSVVGNISDIKTASQMPTVATTTNRRKRKVQPVRIEPEPSQPEDAVQYSDMNLPENESYQQMYGQNLNIYSQNVVGQPGMTRGFGSPGLMHQSMAHLVPQTMSIPIIHTLSSQSHVQNQIYTVHPSMPPQPVSTMYPGDIMMPLECILTEDQDPVIESTSKKARLSPPLKKSGDASKIPEGSKSSLHDKIRDAMNDTDEEECDKPLSSFLGHPNDRVLKQQICDIVEQTDLQDITINTVIQKIFNMYPKYDLNYRKEYIKSTLRSVLYRLGDHKTLQECQTADLKAEDSPDCSVSTTFSCENPERSQSSPISRVLES